MFKNISRNLFILKNHFINNKHFSRSTRMQTESTQITYLDQEAAKKVDEELMQEYGWTMEALMELAGLSTAQAIHDCNSKYHNSSLKKVLVMIGPGNNGGDGYVTANHLKQFGYDPQLLVFRKPEKSLYVGLTKVCEGNNIKINYYDDESTPKEVSKLINDNFDLAVDAMFGFSFKGPLKAPYDKVLPDLKNVTKPIFSIDVPSGWADEGNSYNLFEPTYVISLTLPKLGMKHFKGKHYLGGRFVPAKMIEKNGWKFPNYHSSNQFVEL